MKIPVYASVAMLGFFVATTRAKADPAPSDPVGNAYLQTDPDGVPLSVAHGQSKPTAAQIDAYRQQQAKADADKNWLLRGYEQQRQAHAAAEPAATKDDADTYYEQSLNKNLALLAGVPSFDSTTPNGTTPKDNTASSEQSSTKSSDERTDASKPTSFSLVSPYLLKPVINPLGAPPLTLGLHNYYSNVAPSSGSRSVSGTSRRDDNRDTDLDTPGMIASKKDPLLDPNAADSNLDVLPGESIEDARTHQDNYSKLQLAVPMDADQLHKQQAASLALPTVKGASNATPSDKIPVAKPVPINEDDAPMPVSKAPVISPVHAPIANPYDILNR